MGANQKVKILIVDDERSFALSVEAALSSEYSVSVASEPTEAMKLLNQSIPDLILLDYGLPRISGLEFLKLLKRRFLDIPVIMLTGDSSPETIIETMKAGAADFIIKGTEDFACNMKFRISGALEKYKIAKRNVELEQENQHHSDKNRKLAAKLAVHAKDYEIKGVSEQILKLKRDLLRVKGSSAYILITGENGTGKELVARNLNLQEDDPSRPFVAVNCAAIPSNLFESELFGHVKGSFTGATDNKHGQFKIADGGDIFLDEIGEMPLEMQVKLLRVLQEKTFTPVGSTKAISVDVRVIAATNRNLEAEVRNGKFREDLYYRLNHITFHVPPLRERGEDVEFLAEVFLRKVLPMARISPAARNSLRNYPWRGNIRELQNTIERACVFIKDSSRPILKPEHVGLNLNVLAPNETHIIPKNILPLSESEISPKHFQSALAWIERLYFEKGLQLLRGNNRSLYSLLQISKAHYFNRKKELFGDVIAEGVE